MEPKEILKLKEFLRMVQLSETERYQKNLKSRKPEDYKFGRSKYCGDKKDYWVS